MENAIGIIVAGAFIIGGLIGVGVTYTPKSLVIKNYQECISAGASVEYCEKN